MSTAVMTLQQHRPLQQLQPAKKMVMMLSPPHDFQHAQIVQPSNGACVIVSANGLATGLATGLNGLANGLAGGFYPPSPPHFTNLDSPATTTVAATITTTTASNNNNTAKAKNNNLNKVSRVGGGVVQKPAARTSVVVAAAPVVSSTASSAAASAEALRCKRRIQFAQQGGQGAQAVSFSGHQTASVARRNARERNRVKQVNNGFATLRSHIPPAIAAALAESSGSSGSSSSSERGGSSRNQTAKEKEAAKKLSKVETLRMAVEYIRRLQELLDETTGNNENADPGTPVTVKTESVVMPDSPSGFDADYEAAMALSHYSMAPESTTCSSSVAVAGATTLSSTASVLAGLHAHPHFVSMSPPCSDAGSSPTPSYVSDGSAGASSTGYAPTGPALAPLPCRPAHLAGLSPHTPPDSMGLYEPMSPEDEELLDVISWWQQSN